MWQKWPWGLATILSAEIGQVAFTLALATLGTSQASKRLLYVSMTLSTVVSLMGNIQLALPGHVQSPFAWLEAVVPPLLVLATSFVLKEQLLGTIETRHANEQAFQTALTDWQIATASPEKHVYWQQYYANALRDALRKANYRRTEVLSQMMQGDWCTVVAHEMQAERWYEQPTPDDHLLCYTLQNRVCRLLIEMVTAIPQKKPPPGEALCDLWRSPAMALSSRRAATGVLL